jgi:hypothetical protein
VTESVRALFESLFDYAGLFPPAELEMRDAAGSYARYRGGSHAWMLSRFVLPVARLQEFEIASADFLPPSASAAPWRLSVLSGADVGGTLGVAIDFNQRYSGRAVIDTIEMKALAEQEIIAAEQVVRKQMTPYVEIAMPAGRAMTAYGESEAAGRAPHMLEQIRAVAGRAKIRTGGVTPEARPPIESLAAFIHECCAMEVPFKATAGLHHAVGSARDGMYGFLNLLFATALANRSEPRETVEEVLSEQDPGAFDLGENAAAWRNHVFDVRQLRDARRLFTAVGTCSFEEPIADLNAMGVL